MFSAVCIRVSILTGRNVHGSNEFYVNIRDYLQEAEFELIKSSILGGSLILKVTQKTKTYSGIYCTYLTKVYRAPLRFRISTIWGQFVDKQWTGNYLLRQVSK